MEKLGQKNQKWKSDKCDDGGQCEDSGRNYRSKPKDGTEKNKANTEPDDATRENNCAIGVERIAKPKKIDEANEGKDDGAGGGDLWHGDVDDGATNHHEKNCNGSRNAAGDGFVEDVGDETAFD